MTKNELKNLKKFHGHIGPFVVLGYRMGREAKRVLKGNHKNLKAVVRIITRPPVSCLLDGIQFSSGCTIGRGNLKIIPVSQMKEVKITFQKEKNRLEYKAREELNNFSLILFERNRAFKRGGVENYFRKNVS